jgi:hypothetical protein
MVLKYKKSDLDFITADNNGKFNLSVPVYSQNTTDKI